MESGNIVCVAVPIASIVFFCASKRFTLKRFKHLKEAEREKKARRLSLRYSAIFGSVTFITSMYLIALNKGINTWDFIFEYAMPIAGMCLIILVFATGLGLILALPIALIILSIYIITRILQLFGYKKPYEVYKDIRKNYVTYINNLDKAPAWVQITIRILILMLTRSGSGGTFRGGGGSSGGGGGSGKW